MKHVLFVVGMIIVLLRGYAFAQNDIYQVSGGIVRFHSDAPLEFINATSKGLLGVVDISKRTFLFKISIPSFDGFNSPRQKEHFNENYMESDRFPVAIFSGKIIEDIDISKDGEYTIRAKGKLVIHGVAQQRTIKCRIICGNGKIAVSSDFMVLLADHNIKIPRIVSDKLSSEINVSISAELLSKPNS